MKLKTEEKFTLRPNKKIAPSLLGYFGLLLYFLLFVGIIILFINFFSKNIMMFCIGVGLIVINALLIFLCDNLLAWYYSADIEFNDENYLLTYTKTTVAPSNQNLVKYKVKSISKLKKRKNKLIIYGDIDLKIPYKKIKTVKKCVVFDYKTENNSLLQRIENLKEIG